MIPGATTYPGPSLLPGDTTGTVRDLDLVLTPANSTREVHVSLGGREYVGLIVTESNGQEISIAKLKVAIAPWAGPADDAGWVVPPKLDQVSSSQISWLILVDDTFPPGDYYRWIRYDDNRPEVIVSRYEYTKISIS